MDLHTGTGGRSRPEGRGIGQLLVELTQETSALIRGEMALARAEIDQKVDQAQKGLVAMATGGAVLYAGLLALMFCAIFALGQVMDLWAAALIVGLVVCGIGAALLVKGRADVSKDRLTPARTMRSLRETKDFAKEQAS